MRLVLLAAAFILALPLAAQTRGSCAEGTATATLDDGDVRAGLYPNGNLFFGSASAALQYVVPAGSGTSPIYAAGLWIGGTIGSEVGVAAASFQYFAFRPGPLNADGSVPNPADCSAYDRIFVVSAADVAAYDAGGAPTADLSDWPVAWGAEVVDGDGDLGNYNLVGGDRPKLYGTQTAFWVMNDLATPEQPAPRTQQPIGIEVQVTAAAFDSADPAFAQATLYRFRLIKRTPGTMDDARAGFFTDADLGNGADDFTGTDASRGMAFAYNGDNDDEGAEGYGLNPPAVGFDWLSGAGSNMVVPKGPAAPQESTGFYNALHSRWYDGTPLTEEGNGYQTNGPVVTWAFSGDPVADQFWSMENTDGSGAQATSADIRAIIVTPDLTLAPGVPVDVVLAIPFARGADRLDSITQLRAADDAIQAAYDSGALFPVAGETTAPPVSALALSTPRPNPTAAGASVTLTLPTAGTARVAVVDVLGREVTVVHAGALAAGATTLALPAGLAPGVYVVVAEAADGRAMQRLTVAE